MEGKDKKYTPLVLRTGLFVDYRRTLLIWFTLMVLYTAFNLLGGYQIVVEDALVIGCFTAIILAATWTVRTSVDGFQDLFGLFDESAQESLKLYKPIGEPSITDLPKTKKIFVDDELFDKFRRNLQKIISSPYEVVYLSLTAVAFFVYFIYLLIDPPATITMVFPWSLLSGIIWYFVIFPLIALLTVGGLWIIFRWFVIVNTLSKSEGYMKIENYAPYLHGEPLAESQVMLYNTFFSSISLVGARIYRITSGAVFALVSAVLWLVLNGIYRRGIIQWGEWLLTIIIIPVALIVFIAPQVSIHSLLSRIKENISQAIFEEVDKKQLIYTSLIRSNTTSILSESETIMLKTSVYNSLQGLQMLSENIRITPTWTFRMPTALKLIFTSMVPIIVAIAQTVLVTFIENVP